METRKIYYSITEVARMADVKPHVLRYWETEFATLRPKKNRAGNRTYREKDVRQVLLIRKLLYDDGFTIKGANKRLNERKASDLEQIELPFDGEAAAPAAGETGSAASEDRQKSISSIRKELESILTDLSG